MRQYWTVPRIWPLATVVILGGGPSLSAEQVAAVQQARAARADVHVIAINEAYKLAPWADVLYFSDEGRFFAWNRDLPEFKAFRGLKVAIDGYRVPQTYGNDPAIKVLRNLGDGPGLCELRDGLHTGRNSGFQAINLAVHLGASRIVLLGFDMKPAADGRTQWHRNYPYADPADVYARVMLPHFPTLVDPLRRLGVEVINATPGSALTCFPRGELADVLKARAAA
jgi:hypothetical protein